MFSNYIRKVHGVFKWPLFFLVGSLILTLLGVILSSGILPQQRWPSYGATYVIAVVLMAFFVGPFIIFAHYFSRRRHNTSYGLLVHLVLAAMYLTFILLVIILLIQPAWGEGFENLWGIWMGFFLLFLLVPSLGLEVYLMLTWFYHRRSLQMDPEQHISEHHQMAESPSIGKRVLVLIGVLFFSFFILFIVTLFPAQWNQTTQTHQRSPSSVAIFNHNISPNPDKPWFMKLFPDQLMYWSWCYIILIFSFVFLNIPAAKKILHFPFSFNLIVARCRFSLGELLIIFSFFGLTCWWIWYWSTGYVDPIGNEMGRISQLPMLERTGRTIGHLNSQFISFLMFPIARNSVWQYIFGISYERAIRYHRFLGVLTVLSTSLHMWVWWASWSSLGQFLDQFALHPNVIGPPCENIGKCHVGNFLMPILFFTWCILILIFITALNYFRRRWYEVFYYTHQLTWFYLIVALIHAWAMWNYFLFGGLLY